MGLIAVLALVLSSETAAHSEVHTDIVTLEESAPQGERIMAGNQLRSGGGWATEGLLGQPLEGAVPVIETPESKAENAKLPSDPAELRQLNSKLIEGIKKTDLKGLNAQSTKAKLTVSAAFKALQNLQDQKTLNTKAALDKYASQAISGVKTDAQLEPLKETDCKVSLWTSWGGCRASTGVKDGASYASTRTRKIVKLSATGRCPSLSEKRLCLDCSLGPWGTWGLCTGGKRVRTRTILQAPENGGKNCMHTKQSESCGNADTPTQASVVAAEVQPQADNYASGLDKFLPKRHVVDPGNRVGNKIGSLMVQPRAGWPKTKLKKWNGFDMKVKDIKKFKPVRKPDTKNVDINILENRKPVSRNGEQDTRAGPDFLVGACVDKYSRWCAANVGADHCKDPLYVQRCQKTCGCDSKKRQEKQKYEKNKPSVTDEAHEALSTGKLPKKTRTKPASIVKEMVRQMRPATVQELSVAHCKPEGSDAFWGDAKKVARELVPKTSSVSTPLAGNPGEYGSKDETRGRARCNTIHGKLVRSKYNPKGNAFHMEEELFFAQSLNSKDGESTEYAALRDSGMNYCIRRTDSKRGVVKMFRCFQKPDRKGAENLELRYLMTGSNWQSPETKKYSTNLYVFESMPEIDYAMVRVISREGHQAMREIFFPQRVAAKLNTKTGAYVTSVDIVYDGVGAEWMYFGVSLPKKASDSEVYASYIYRMNLRRCSMFGVKSVCRANLEQVIASPDMSVVGFAVYRAANKIYIADSKHNSVLRATLGYTEEDRVLSTLAGPCGIHTAAMIRRKCAQEKFNSFERQTKCCHQVSAALQVGERPYCCATGKSEDAYGRHTARFDFQKGADLSVHENKKTGEALLWIAETGGRKLRRVDLTASDMDVTTVASIVEPLAVAGGSSESWVFDGSYIARIDLSVSVPCGQVMAYTLKPFANWTMGGREVDTLCLRRERAPAIDYYPWVAIRTSMDNKHKVCIKPVIPKGMKPPTESCCEREVKDGQVSMISYRISSPHRIDTPPNEDT